MNFNDYVNMLIESYNASEKELGETLKKHQQKILNLHKKVRKAGYGEIAKKELDTLNELLLSATKEYKNFVNSHMDTILLYPNIFSMYTAFNEVLKTIKVLTSESIETEHLVAPLKHIINRVEFNYKICAKFLSGKRAYADGEGVYKGAHNNVNSWLKQYNEFKDHYKSIIGKSPELSNMISNFEKLHPGFFR